MAKAGDDRFANVQLVMREIVAFYPSLEPAAPEPGSNTAE
jgi:hypothetical protein